ncbi:unnamed protein product [Arctia plantaginis]|uniref:WASH complex subunit 2 n=1 Tax=Arctia plantaginis TaxID=874455 RepID=A0A8S0ZY17_ARCPL|nr:unnamed protein product [Arctia plantaginis]
MLTSCSLFQIKQLIMEETDTDTLRKLAPCWSLAGDERLLTILQNTHQRLITKCQAANSQLEQMATALDDANISLQNVNNQFMALSSSQFVERRVYDDDVDVAAEPPAAKEPPKLSPPDELSILKRSIAVIEKTHEVITILQDSDTESDTDDEMPDRLVMKPKDMYADRPLPYIIGSEPWKNKWHAGLMPEDSDTDSSTSKVDRESDQYSQSEPEDFDLVNSSKVQDIPAPRRVRKLSETSSDVPSETTPNTKPTPSDVASEIARRLGGGELPPRVVEQEPEDEEPPKPAVRKVYKPQEPVASTIFPDEPPPLEYQTDSDTDIFADLHRKQPYNQPYSRQYVSDQLFGGNETDSEEGGDIFSDFANQPATKPVSLFEAGPTPHMFDKQRGVDVPGVGRTLQKNTETLGRSVEQPNAGATVDVKSVKKPVGGISLFGSNKGAENIGAAILKRNRSKSYTSSEESGTETPSKTSPIRGEKEQQAKKEKDIFDDLFPKTESKKVMPKRNNVEKDIKQEIQKQKEDKQKKDTPKPIDLFSDNLFDDIDDIFTTSVVKESKDKNKSIFEGDDDLFAEVADKNSTVHQNPKNTLDDKKGLFDSDDDLFSENVPKNKPSIYNEPQKGAEIRTNPIKVNEPRTVSEISSKNDEEAATNATMPDIIKGKASIFDDDENDIFSNVKSNKNNSKAEYSSSKGAVAKNIDTSKSIFKSPSLFDDDDDEGNLFTDPNKTQKNIQNDATEKVFITSIVKPENVVNVIKKDTDDELSVETFNKPEFGEDEFYKNNLLVANKILDETPSKNKTEITDSNSVISDDIKNDRKEIDNDDIFKQNDLIKTDVFKEPKTITNVVAKDTLKETEDTTTERNGRFVDNDFLSNVIENSKLVCTTNLNIHSETTEAQNLFVDTASNNNFNQEEFNDECIEETKTEISKNNITEITSKELDPDKPNINIHDTLKNLHTFVNSSLGKDIFATPNNISSFEEATISSIEKPEDVNKIPNADIFSDIISEPPDFEKPKEPKKSKNVNALFDDDSDDETLFFKRDDVIVDEKPEDFTAKQDRLFDMFTSEPPDEDFTNINDGLDDDLFSTLPKPKLPHEHIAASNIITDDEYNKPTLNDIPNVSDDIKTEAPPNIFNLKENNEDLVLGNSEIIKSGPSNEAASIFNDNNNMSKQPESLIRNRSEKLLTDDYDDDDELFKSLPIQLPGPNIDSKSRNYDNPDESFMSLPSNLDGEISNEFRKPPLNFKLPTEPSDSNSRSEVKKVGKLKLGLNINVNALLPGASPKKIKPVDNIDGQTQSQVEIQKAEPIIFDGEPEAKILDNKLSKERPRIPVKRRPSTRKARKEAVRKSGIDFGDDSTDNSSSLDDAPKKEIRPDVKITDKISDNDIEQPTKEDISSEDKYEEKQKVELENTGSENLNVENENPIDISVENKNKTDIIDNQTKIESDSRPPVKSDSTTKIVYILNDEDIFNTTNIEDPLNKMNLSPNQSKEQDPKNTELSSEQNLSSVITDSNLIANMNSEPGIKTLGKTYQSIKSNENKKSKSLFGEDEESDDEEIFKNKKTVVKSTIFDSDSEGELFGTAKKIETVQNVEKVVKEVKRPLFGDDDDDDLFGVKTSKPAESQQSTKSSTVKETSKLTEPVFEDPLSMFGDED